MTQIVGQTKPNKFLRLAVEVAKLSRGEQKHGAVVVKNGSVVSAGNNIKRMTPHLNGWRCSYRHSEAVALSGCSPKGC